MTDTALGAGNGGTKLPVLPVLFVLLTAIVTGLTSWMFKVDDRLYALTREVPTRAELNTRLDRIDQALASLADRTPRRN
ncbi:MAG: hypothetical protein GC191_09555 [Azospirillum sp.]|nr:hypothetical protein [Azospirillum sp.]